MHAQYQRLAVTAPNRTQDNRRTPHVGEDITILAYRGGLITVTVPPETTARFAASQIAEALGEEAQDIEYSLTDPHTGEILARGKEGIAHLHGQLVELGPPLGVAASSYSGPHWKPGQTVRWRRQWAVVTYLLNGGREAIITFDDGTQVQVSSLDLISPRVLVPARDLIQRGRR